MNERKGQVQVEILTAEALDDAWQLRLRALRDHPDAFGQPYLDAVALSGDEIRNVFDTFWNFRDNRVLVARCDDGSLAGMTGLARWYRDKQWHRANIWGMYVVPDWRGSTVAEALVTAALDYGRDDLNLLQVHLDVMSSNHRAVRFYERMGFVRCGRVPRAEILDGVSLDQDVMVRIFDDYPPGGTNGLAE